MSFVKGGDRTWQYSKLCTQDSFRESDRDQVQVDCEQVKGPTCCTISLFHEAATKTKWTCVCVCVREKVDKRWWVEKSMERCGKMMQRAGKHAFLWEPRV